MQKQVERINRVFGDVCRRFKLRPSQLPGIAPGEIVRMVKAVDPELNKKARVGVDDPAMYATAVRYSSWMKGKK